MHRPLRTLCAAILVLTLAGCGGGRERPKADLAASKVTTIGVNSYLWRATLDTLSFMPLLQTDSNGGVVVTDWYINPSTPTERMKVTVSILDQDLRARRGARRGAAPGAAGRPVGRGARTGGDRPEAGGHHPHPRPRPAPHRRRGGLRIATAWRHASTL